MSDGPIYGAVIRHEVADFDAWKRAFDDHEGARREGGIVMHNLHRNDEKPNDVLIYLSSPNLKALQGMVASDNLKAAMMKAGVVGAPQITLVQNREMNVNTDGTAKAGAVIRHRGADYDTWKAAFDDHDSVRKTSGVLGYSVNTVVGSDNDVVALAQSDSIDELRAMFGSADLAAAMKAAGVTGPPEIVYVNHVEMKRY